MVITAAGIIDYVKHLKSQIGYDLDLLFAKSVSTIEDSWNIVEF